MGKQVKLNESWNVQFYSREASTNEDVGSVSMNWENRDVETTMKNLNTWLTAVGVPLKVVESK
jgi:hypothetical protein